jgi:hypothetical protein
VPENEQKNSQSEQTEKIRTRINLNRLLIMDREIMELDLIFANYV